jgi:hypothetical protein
MRHEKEVLPTTDALLGLECSSQEGITVNFVH